MKVVRRCYVSMFSIEISLKVLIVLFYLTYLALYHLNFSFASVSMKYRQSLIERNPCVIIIGGSNSMYGLSAEYLSASLNCSTLNLSMSPGGIGTFKMYSNWVSSLNISPRFIIYSPSELWSQVDISEVDFPAKERIPIDAFPRIELISIVSAFFFAAVDGSVNSFGDYAHKGSCQAVLGRNFDLKKFDQASNNVASNILGKITRLKAAFPHAVILLNVPPIAVIAGQSIDIENAMRVRLNMVSQGGFSGVVPSSFLFSEESKYFCDASHANRTGSVFFTTNLLYAVPQLRF